MIKKFTIGSDDDDLTLHAIDRLPEISGTGDLLTSIQNHERADEMPDRLVEVTSYEFYQAAYAAGYAVYLGMARDAPTEIVYLVKGE
jgi:hypothetical protein